MPTKVVTFKGHVLQINKSRTRDETADWKHQCSEKLLLAHATQFIKPDNMR